MSAPESTRSTKRRTSRSLVLAPITLFPPPCQLSPEGRSARSSQRGVSSALFSHRCPTLSCETRFTPLKRTHAILCGLKGPQGLMTTLFPILESFVQRNDIACSLWTSPSLPIRHRCLRYDCPSTHLLVPSFVVLWCTRYS